MPGNKKRYPHFHKSNICKLCDVHATFKIERQNTHKFSSEANPWKKVIRCSKTVPALEYSSLVYLPKIRISFSREDPKGGILIAIPSPEMIEQSQGGKWEIPDIDESRSQSTFSFPNPSPKKHNPIFSVDIKENPRSRFTPPDPLLSYCYESFSLIFPFANFDLKC